VSGGGGGRGWKAEGTGDEKRGEFVWKAEESTGGLGDISRTLQKQP